MNAKIDFIIKTIKKILKKEITLDQTSAITTLGLTSLQMIQLAMVIEEEYGSEINPEAMSKVNNVIDLALLIQDK